MTFRYLPGEEPSCMADPITSAQPDDRDIATLDRIYGGPGEPEAQGPPPALPL